MLRYDNALATDWLDTESYENWIRKAEESRQLLFADRMDRDCCGWVEPTAWPQIEALAQKVRNQSDVFVVIGIGGSNQCTRAMVDALRDSTSGPELIFAGDTLSGCEMARVLKYLEGKRFSINCIAKNFSTLEPGSHFRMIRKLMESQWDAKEVADRITVTGTIGSHLEALAKEHGWAFLPFPLEVGGRYTACTPVSLFPMAVAGLDTKAYVQGMQHMHDVLASSTGSDNLAVRYAATRQSLNEKGFHVEVLATFEPRLDRVGKWWRQLFGESEGKKLSGIFPTIASYSEDLHSLGQYMQDGMRILQETYISVTNPGPVLTIPADDNCNDEFSYLDGKDFHEVNAVAQQATLAAHHSGGVPQQVFTIEQCDERSMGELLYAFMVSCALSAHASGINPFDQEGVEDYKRNMFRGLGK